VASSSATGPECDDLAAVLPRSRADVDDPVGGGDGVLVVLDDDEGVAEVAQPHQGLDEPVVVALVQADRGLVEDVEHAHQAGPDLGRQADALGLAAGQRARRAIERQVVESHVDEEAQPGGDLLETRSAICRSRSVRVRVSEESAHSPMGRHDLRDVRPPTVTASDSGLRRAPPHTGHGHLTHVALVALRGVGVGLGSAAA
jgi:hypothetical protein